MEFATRHMADGDLQAVAALEAGVFTDWNRIYRREREPLPERTIEELRYSLSLDPDGSYVAVAADGAMVGFILSRTWGRVGWFGTFGVPTQFHGLGIGSSLIERALDYLRGRCSVVGIETMSESGANIGLYSKMGFVATCPTMILELALIRNGDRFAGVAPDDVELWSELSSTGRSRAVAGVRDISSALLEGLDYSREIQALSSSGLGRTLLSRGGDGRLDGFAILRTSPFRREDNSGRAFIHALGIRPGAVPEDVFDDLLRQIWATATSKGLSRLAVGVNARHQHALGLLLANGFRAVRSALRMVHTPAPDDVFRPSDVIDMSRWAG